MTTETATTTPTIAELNDRFRKGDRSLGKTVGSEIFSNLSPDQKLAIIRLVREFDDFNEGNDPHQEHDFGSVEYDGDKWLWKIDYYDPNYEHGSEDPANPAVTRRLMTIMLASEY